MYKTKSHAKQMDPTSITDPISKAKEKAKADAIKESNKRKAARGDFSYMTDAEKKKQAKELSQVQAQKSKAAEDKRNAEGKGPNSKGYEYGGSSYPTQAAADAAKAKAEKKGPAPEKKGPAPEKKGPAPKKSTSYADAAKKDPKLNSYIKQRKGLTKGTPEYNAVQNKINAAYGKGPQRSTKTLDSSKKKSTIKSSVVDDNPVDKEKAAREKKAAELAELKKTATTKIDKKNLRKTQGTNAVADAKKAQKDAAETLSQRASGEKAIEYKEKTKKEKIQDTKEDFSFDRKKLKREKGTDAVKEARAKKREEVGRAKGKKKIVEADNRASYAEAAKKNMNLEATLNDSPMLYAGMKMKKSKPMMKGKLCMKSFRSGRRG